MVRKQTPSCASGHGLMVPTGVEYAFAPNGVVVATVEWEKPGPRMQALVYAPNSEVARQLPSVERGGRGGEVIDALMQAGQLFPVNDLYPRLTECYRVDDQRQGHHHTYLVWTGTARGRGPTLQKGVVYHFLEQGATPGVGTVRDLQALMALPNVLTIASTKGYGKLTVDEMAQQRGLDMTNCVVVWDLYRIYNEK